MPGRDPKHMAVSMCKTMTITQPSIAALPSHLKCDMDFTVVFMPIFVCQVQGTLRGTCLVHLRGCGRCKHHSEKVCATRCGGTDLVSSRIGAEEGEFAPGSGRAAAGGICTRMQVW